MSHQIDPKTSSDDDEWVYIDLADFGKAAAISKGDEDGASGEDSCSDDVYSDYSGEGRLEKAYESDEDLDQIYNSHADAAEEEDGTSGEDAYSDDDCSDYSDEDLDQVTESESDYGAFDLLDQVTESESDHGAFDLKELDEYLEVEEFITNHITNHAKDTRKEKEVDGAAAPAADAVVDPAACATNEHFDDAAANDFSDYYYYDHGDYNVGAGGEHNVGCGLAYHDYYYSSYGRSSGYGYGGGDYFNGSFYGNGGGGGYFSGDFYGNGGGGGYYGGGYGYGGDGYRAGLHPRLPRLPYNPPGVGLFQPLPAASYELPYPYAASAQPSSQYGIVYIPRPASSPMAAAPPEPQP